MRLHVALRVSLLLWAGAALSWLTHADGAITHSLAANPAIEALQPLGEAYSRWGLFLFYIPFLALLIVGQRTQHAQFKVIGQAYLLAQSCGTVLLVHLVKLVTARPRPLANALHDAFFQIPSLAGAIHSSFPSSHAVDVMVGAVFASTLARSRTTAGLSLAAAVLMAIARVVIGKHYLSDVLAGLALGTAIAAVALHAFLLPRWQTPDCSPPG